MPSRSAVIDTARHHVWCPGREPRTERTVPMGDGDRIRELERQLEALRAAERDDAGKTQIVKRPIGDDDRIAALERKIEEVVGSRDIDQRPAIQVIQRTETNVDAGKKKRQPTEAEDKATLAVGIGCGIAMIIFAAWCASLGAIMIW